MSEVPHNTSGEPPEPPDWSRLTPEQQHVMLLSNVHTSRMWLEEVFQDPATSMEEREQIRAKKAAADQALVEFQIKHGILPPPPEG
ncbi:hypothetical protein BH09PAT4_BH09PAT4_08050 [soil metagenome]